MYKAEFKDPVYYVFQKVETGERFFVGVFGTVGVITKSIRMSDEEITGFRKDKAIFLQALWDDIERNTARYYERFVQVDDDPDIVSIIRETSFGNPKTSLLDKVLAKFR